MIRILATEAEAATTSFPTVWFGVAAFTVFTLLALITWSFRDVANRHKDSNDKAHH